MSTQLTNLLQRLNTVTTNLTKVQTDLNSIKTDLQSIINSTKPPSTTGILVPYYLYPTQDKLTQLLAPFKTYTNVPLIVILNPDSGAGATRDPVYATAVTTLQQAKAFPVGYVSTRYNQRPINEVQAEIDKYVSWYNMPGVFLDEQGTNANYYTQLMNFAKQKGMTRVITNPGGYTPPDNRDILRVIYEDGTIPDLNIFTPWIPYRQNAGMLLHSLNQLPSLTEILKIVGWIYVTNDVMDNPWDTLPSYWLNLVQTISQVNK